MSKLLRELIKDAGESQRSIAKQIGINERTMRRYCSPTDPIQEPKYIRLAVERYLSKKGAL